MVCSKDRLWQLVKQSAVRERQGQAGKREGNSKGSSKGKAKGKGHTALYGFQRQYYGAHNVKDFRCGECGYEWNEPLEYQDGEWLQICLFRQSTKVKETQQNLVNLLGKGSMFDFKVLKEDEDAEDCEHETKVEAVKETEIKKVQLVQNNVKSRKSVIAKNKSEVGK